MKDIMMSEERLNNLITVSNNSFMTLFMLLTLTISMSVTNVFFVVNFVTHVIKRIPDDIYT